MSESLLRACATNGFWRVREVISLFSAGRLTSAAPGEIAQNPPDLNRLAVSFGLLRGESNINWLQAGRRNGGVIFFDATIRKRTLSTRRRVSPRSLSMRPFQKAIWNIAPLAFDPGTMEQLLETCPVCEKFFGFSRTQGVCFCENCTDPTRPYEGSTDLRDYPQPIVRVEDVEALRFVTNLIDPLPLFSNASMPVPLLGMSKGEIFELAVEIARLVDRSRSGDEAGYSDVVSPASLSEAGRALLEWPTGFYRLSKVFPENWFEDRQHHGRFWHPLRRAVSGRYFSNQVKSLIYKALSNTFASVNLGKFNETDPVCNSAKFEFEALCKAARSQSNIAKEALKTGVPVPTLVRGYLSGVFSCPDAWIDESEGSLSLLQMLNNLPSPTVRHRNFLLCDAVATFYRGTADPWPHIFKLISEGNAGATRAKGAKPLIQRVFVDDMVKWSQLLKGLEIQPDGNAVQLKIREASFYLNMSENAVIAARSLGLLDHDLIFSSVRCFSETYVSMGEIAFRSTVNGTPLTARAASRRLNEAGIIEVCLSGIRRRQDAFRYFNEDGQPLS
ncbi:hypothetical protein [Rhizobium johnstonii]|uniref:hypothetical protein n=1 Tax=Rhizobium johnstonii TaxID=3019933 RepID=UPI003F9A1E75